MVIEQVMVGESPFRRRNIADVFSSRGTYSPASMGLQDRSETPRNTIGRSYLYKGSTRCCAFGSFHSCCMCSMSHKNSNREEGCKN